MVLINANKKKAIIKEALANSWYTMWNKSLSAARFLAAAATAAISNGRPPPTPTPPTPSSVAEAPPGAFGVDNPAAAAAAAPLAVACKCAAGLRAATAAAMEAINDPPTFGEVDAAAADVGAVCASSAKGARAVFFYVGASIYVVMGVYHMWVCVCNWVDTWRSLYARVSSRSKQPKQVGVLKYDLFYVYCGWVDMCLCVCVCKRVCVVFSCLCVCVAVVQRRSKEAHAQI